MSSNDISIGLLMGLAHRNNLNDRKFADECIKLKRQIREARVEVLVHEAQKEAIKRCIEEFVDERKSGSAPRHSDPKAAALRGEDFLDTAELHLRTLSNGALSFGYSLNKIKQSKRDINSIVESHSFQPTVCQVVPPAPTPGQASQALMWSVTFAALTVAQWICEMRHDVT